MKLYIFFNGWSEFMIKSSLNGQFDTAPYNTTILNCLKYIDRQDYNYFFSMSKANAIVEFEADEHSKQRKFIRILK